jgi:hypothetical protein
MDARACGRGLMRGVYTKFTTENIFCSKQYRPRGFDHGVGHSLLVLCDAKAPHDKKWNDFKALENYLFIVSISSS